MGGGGWGMSKIQKNCQCRLKYIFIFRLQAGLSSLKSLYFLSVLYLSKNRLKTTFDYRQCLVNLLESKFRIVGNNCNRKKLLCSLWD